MTLDQGKKRQYQSEGGGGTILPLHIGAAHHCSSSTSAIVVLLCCSNMLCYCNTLDCHSGSAIPTSRGRVMK